MTPTSSYLDPIASRFAGLELATGTTDRQTTKSSPSETFGSFALSWRAIASELSSEDAHAFTEFVQGQRVLDKHTANRVADLVLAWALKHGATHYTHWFQPLTGLPAEKHDAFLALKTTESAEVVALEELRGSLLMQGEPDASSFPSGGLRTTHTARGYTVWDPHTPMFLREDGHARTLCVPSAFISYTGHALDHKTPLLRALSVLDREATRFLNLLKGDASVTRVTATLGAEQEYFLVDKRHFDARPDLVMTGRTLLGKLPTRNQQLEDHYFGAIPARIQAFMVEVETELYRLGVPIKTRHLEVAPRQFELAPIFEDASVSCDHNVLTMDVLRRVADRHGLVCLLHEKPFAGINGSGKHNNWSMATQSGENLLDPGTNEADQLRFMAVLSAVLLAVHRHADVLRVTIASAGNDHRLGANEAPPSIISAYLGDAIDAMATSIERGEPLQRRIGDFLAITDRLGVQLDATDRNRTAPFAFTGNKFEFRAVGATDNCAWPMAVLNAAVAESFAALGDRLEVKLKDGDRKLAVLELVREALEESKAVRFEGNGYGAEWVVEAKRRGLPNFTNTPSALAVLLDEGATRFLVDTNVFSLEEIHSRYEIYAERYVKTLEIEAGTLADVALEMVLPALETQLAQTAAAFGSMVSAGLPRANTENRLRHLGESLERIQTHAHAIEALLDSLHEATDAAGIMERVVGGLIPALSVLREACDEAEGMVAESLWPLPKYRQMLFPVE